MILRFQRRGRIMNKGDCIKLIKDFIEEKLNGDINEFISFDMKLIRNDKKYGGSEPDNTKIMNAIYVVIWSDKISDMIFNELSPKGIYRGDIINSFKTILGKPIRENGEIIHFRGIKKHTNNKETIERSKRFRKIYHTIGNMTPLVNKHSGAKSLNQYKGTCGWHDYFDLFLQDLYLCYHQDFGSKDRKALNEYMTENENFFMNYKGIAKFENFIKDFYLDLYVNSDAYVPISIFEPHYFHWRKPQADEKEYIKYVDNYVTNASKIITYRGKKMVEELKKNI